MPDDEEMRFRFTARNIPAAEKELELRINALDARIEKIVHKVSVGGGPILHPILNASRSRTELELLGKALLRVAPLVEELDDLRKRLGVLELAKSDPKWLAWAFGDFGEELDAFLNEVQPQAGSGEEDVNG